MKKQIVFILSFLCLSLGVYAQSENGGGLTQRRSTPQQGERSSGRSISVKAKNNNFEFSIGPRAGFGLTTLSESEGLKVADGAGFGFDAGLGLNVRFGSKDSHGRALNGQGLFGVGLELNYASYSSGTVDKDNLNLGYFEVPLLLQFYPAFQTRQLKNLYIEIGPTFSMLVSKSPKELQADDYTKYLTGDLKGGDVKGSIGVGYRFSNTAANDGLYVNFRYNMGFSKLAGNFPAKFNKAELTIGYLFKCVGGKKKGQDTTPQRKQRTNKNVLR